VSAVAVVTERVEIGTLVMCSSFRSPGLLAKMATTFDEVSGARLILGIGAGWHDPEYPRCSEVKPSRSKGAITKRMTP
jgi:FMNH2-dependent dimethyl sulfone monooxygenase